MTTLTTTDFTPGTTILSAAMNNNFAAVEAVVNGNIDNANINASAAIAVSKLASGSVHQVLQMSSGVPTWVNGHIVYDRSPADVVVSNTTTETTVWSKTLTGGHLGSDRILRITVLGQFVKNASGNLTIDFEIDGSDVIGRSYTVSDSALNRLFKLVVEVAAQSTSVGCCSYLLNAGTASVNLNEINDVVIGPTSQDWTTDRLLAITAQWSAASSNLQFTKMSAFAELL